MGSFFGAGAASAHTFDSAQNGDWAATSTWNPAIVTPWSVGSSATADIAIDSEDNVYAVNFATFVIKKFTSDGTLLTEIGSQGSGDGQFTNPVAVTVDAAGNVYVVDSTQDRIQKFSSDGTFVTKWGSTGSANGQFSNPNEIAVDSLGNVYVIDFSLDRVQKFTSDGTFVTKWGTSGSGDSQFGAPVGLAIDSDDNVYVGDVLPDRIQKFTSDGTFVTKWGSAGSADGQFSAIEDIAVDSMNNVYVSDASLDNVQKFTSDGTFVTKWGSNGTGDGQFTSPESIAVDSEDNVYVLDSFNVEKFIPGIAPSTSDVANISDSITLSGDQSITDLTILAGGSLAPGGNTLTVAGDFSNSGTFTAGTSTVVLTGTANTISGENTFYNLSKTVVASSTLYFDPGATTTITNNLVLTGTSGNLLTLARDPGALPVFDSTWGSSGIGDSQFDTPHGIAIDDSGNIYVSDTKNHRIQKFSSAAAFISEWGSSGAAEGQFNSPLGMAFDADGNIWVADNKNQRIQKFTADGVFIKMWGWGVATGAAQFESCTSSCQIGLGGDGDGEFSAPHGIAFDAAGHFYVSNFFANNVQEFDAEGNFVANHFAAGGGFNGPDGISIDGDGNIYIINTAPLLQKFDSDMSLIFDTTDATFNTTHNVVASETGAVYVSDNFGHQVHVLDSAGNLLGAFGEEGSGEGQFDQPYGLAIGPDGDLFVVEGLNNRVQRFSVPAGFAIDPQGTVDVSFLSVSNSVNAAATAIECTTGCVNGGSNTNWTFTLDPPAVTTVAASNVNTSGAILNGSIDDLGSETPTSRGFHYGLTAGYGETITENGSFSAGAFGANISSLSCGTLYHFRVWATNSVGTGTGSDANFTTSNCPASGGSSAASRSSEPEPVVPSGPLAPMVPLFTTPSPDSIPNTYAEQVVFLQDLIQTLRQLIEHFDLSPSPITSPAPSAPGSGPADSAPTPSQPGAPATPGTYTRDLTLGSTGDDVASLQTLLIDQDKGPAARALAEAGATGYFGPLTRAALAEYQASVDIAPAEGYFGPLTRAHVSAL